MTYYDQSTQGDRQIDVDRPMMLVNAVGTALRSDAGVDVHCHLVLGDALGMASGGDLSPGCVVFSCELILQELAGPPLARALDEATGLSHADLGTDGRCVRRRKAVRIDLHAHYFPTEYLDTLDEFGSQGDGDLS